MTPGTPAWIARTAVRLYAIILALYPADFRARCATPMLRTFEEWALSASARRSPGGFLRECASEFASALAGAWRSRGAAPVYDPQQSTVRDSLIVALAQDSRYALRRLASQPALVGFTVLTLGFAIAANAALFSVVDAVLLRPSPFADADRLMNVLTQSPRGFTFSGLTPTKLKHWRSERELFEAVEAYRETTVVVTGGPEPQELPAAELSPGLLATLAVAPRYGRLFSMDDARRAERDAVIVSEGVARTRFGGESAVGRQLTVNGRLRTVVGVMPERFHFPTIREQLWLPLDPDAPPAQGERTANVLVRLHAGLTPLTAKPRIDAIVARLEVERPLPSGWKIVLEPGGFAGPDERTRRAVLVLFGAVALVLLTACANVANLLLSRAIDRHREFTIRLVLGASRLRLFRELLVEGLLLGLACGAVGLLVARWGIDSLVALAPDTLLDATRSGIAVDGRVVIFGFVISLLTGVLCNVPPALRTLRGASGQALSGRSRTSTATPLQRRFRATLVVAEISLAVVLLIGAALMVRSFIKLNAVDVGFNPGHLLAVTVGLDADRYNTEVERFAMLQRVARDVEGLTGVRGVAVSNGMPPHAGMLAMAWLESENGPCANEPDGIVANVVTPNFLSLLGVRMADGRPLRADDPPDAVVVSQGIARRCGATSLTGRRLRLSPRSPWLTVVGTSADVRTLGITHQEGDLAIYVAASFNAVGIPIADRKDRRLLSRFLVVQADNPRTLVPDIKRILWAHDANQPILGTETAAELMAGTIRRERFLLMLMSLFSAVALALAAAGIFGVLAYAVAQRVNEFGIRMALGAASSDILKLVVGHGLLMAAAGSAAGVGIAFAFARVLAGLLYEVDPRDPVVFIVIPAVVFVVALLASWIPTMRAVRIDPCSALRVD